MFLSTPSHDNIEEFGNMFSGVYIGNGHWRIGEFIRLFIVVIIAHLRMSLVFLELQDAYVYDSYICI